METVCLILSGGLDSGTMLADLINTDHRVLAISFDYDQSHRKELVYARRLVASYERPPYKGRIEHIIVDLRNISKHLNSALTGQKEIPDGHYEDENMKVTVVPNRNMVMLSIAASIALSKEIKKIFIGSHSGDHAIYPDCRPKFNEKLAELFKICHFYPLELIPRYQNLSKADIVHLGLAIGVPYHLTWSCYKGGDKQCGTCGTCVERKEAFAKNKIKDPQPYEVE